MQTAKERAESMKKLCEFEIPNCEDRSNLCAILAVAGYAARVEERTDYSRSFPYTYFAVEVYGKDGEG